MPVRSDRLFGPVVLPTGGFVQLCEVPGSQVWIVKNLRVVAITDVSCFYDLTLIDGDPAAALNWMTVLTARSINVDSTWQVLDQGDTLFGRASVADAAVIWGSGAKLNL